ncbi:DUF4249 domain-containing protein [Marinoscillum sp.]|uniref:DUF4249 domain-containing protein n=1 Tax=Marinoscillum sp. TaxID=2024838 RepID=UPI003BABB784
MRNRLRNSLLIIIVILTSCIEQFDPNINESNSARLVIECLITNENAPHFATLSRTKSIDLSLGSERIPGAIVTIKDDLNNSFGLIELSNGRYMTDTASFTPTVGRSYSLHVELPSGERYVSDMQEMLSPEPIGELTIMNDVITSVSNNSDVESKVAKVITNIPSSETPKYFWHEYEGVFAFETPKQGSEDCFYDSLETPPPGPPVRCFAFEEVSSKLNLYSNDELQTTETDNPTLFTFYPSFKFSIAYNMLIKRYRISKDVYNYFDQIRLQQEFGGSLFDPPPTEILGNMAKIDNPDEHALGMFIVATRTSKRTIIRPTDFKVEQLPNEAYPDCFPQQLPPPTPPELQPRPVDYCCDCRLYPNSSTTRPSYWNY